MYNKKTFILEYNSKNSSINLYLFIKKKWVVIHYRRLEFTEDIRTLFCQSCMPYV